MKTPFLCPSIMADGGGILVEKPTVIVGRLGSSLDSAIFHGLNLCVPVSPSIKMRITLE